MKKGPRTEPLLPEDPTVGLPEDPPPDRPEDPAPDSPEKPASRQTPRKPRRSFLGFLGRAGAGMLAGILDLALVGIVALAAFAYVTLTDLPDTDTLKEVTLWEPLRVYSADGGLMAEYGIERRSPVSFDAIPPLLVKAFLATEDARFFEHEGVDLKSIGRAALSFIQTGKRIQGGSTITMQVARNFFLSRKKTFRRKFAELLLSLNIESTLDKEEILELYLNQIFFGHRAYGISAAAHLYYDKELDELSIAEIAMLAGLPKAPSANNPVSDPERAYERRNYILQRMRDLGYITQEEFSTASESPDQARLHRREVDLEAGYVAEMVRREMFERHGENAYRKGYRITTTIDPRLQRSAQNAVRKALRAYDRRHGYRGAEAKYEVADATDEDLDRLLDAVQPLPDLTAGIVTRAGAKTDQVYIGGGERIEAGLRGVTAGDLIRLIRNDKGTWKLSQAPSVTGALVALSPMDGAVRALVGGYYYDGSKFNRAVDAHRQPGSSFKPFVYAAALDRGYTPASLFRDEPISIKRGRRKAWRPKNADHTTMGRIRMRVALTLSRNLASIDLLKRVGLDEAKDYVRRFGFDFEGAPVGLSMVLGTLEVSPLQIAGAYAVFANGGFRVPPYFISRIENSAGEVFETDPPRACSDCWARYRESPAETAVPGRTSGPLAERVLDPGLAYEMTSMMQDVIKRGTARKALRLKRKDLAGKTGTTNDVRDSWFCGFQKDLVTVAWIGHDEPRPLGRRETGGQAGLGMWMDFMREALENKPQAVLDPPEGMVRVRVSKHSGRRARSGGLVEWIRGEYAHAPEGPKPIVAYTKATGQKKTKTRTKKKKRKRGSKKRKQSTPRVIDDLF